METYEGNKVDYDNDRQKNVAANPCSQCKKMFQEELGIERGIKAPNRKSRDKKPKDWDGRSNY